MGGVNELCAKESGSVDCQSEGLMDCASVPDLQYGTGVDSYVEFLLRMTGGLWGLLYEFCPLMQRC